MIELLAATSGALLSAIFISAGSLSYRGKKNREDVVTLITKVELMSDKMDSMHDDMRSISARLNGVEIGVASLKPKR